MNVSPRYDIGAPQLRDIWVDPVAGDDAADGSSRALAVRTLASAWRLIPERTPAEHGWQILLCPGKYTPNAGGQILLEDRHGSHACPIVIKSADGAATIELPQFSARRCSWLYLFDLTLRAASNPDV